MNWKAMTWIRKRTVMAVTCGLVAGIVFFLFFELGWIVRVTERLCGVGLAVKYQQGSGGGRIARRSIEREACVDYRHKAKRDVFFKGPFSCVWDGFLDVPEGGEYDFFSKSDDGLRMRIDGQTILDNWRVQDWGESGCHGVAKLTRGRHKLQMEFFSEGGGALKVKWGGGPVPANTVLGGKYIRWR